MQEALASNPVLAKVCFCSGGETRTPNKRINSPLLCRLSYPGRRSPKGRAARRIPEANPNSGPEHATPPDVGQSISMKFRTGFVVGLGVGFVLGARGDANATTSSKPPSTRCEQTRTSSAQRLPPTVRPRRFVGPRDRASSPPATRSKNAPNRTARRRGRRRQS